MKTTVRKIERMKDSSAGMRSNVRRRVRSAGADRPSSVFKTSAALMCCLILSLTSPAFAASWGPYNLTTQLAIYSPADQGSSLNIGWYTTTAGKGASRVVLKAADAYMNTMPDASLVSGSTFTIVYYNRYSTTANNPVNMYRIGQTWTTSATWTSPWGAGGNYSSVGTAAQNCVNPTPGTVYTFSPGAGYNFPYGVLFRGATESSITYRKSFYNTPYPTLRVNYTPPADTANGNIRSWAYLGHYAQGATADHVTRVNTDHVSGTYGGVSVDETTIAPNAANGSTGYSYGNSYGTYQWKQGTGSADVVNLLESGFYNAATKDNGTTYAAVYMWYSGTTSSASYIGWGSDDDCKIYINGVLRGSFLGDGRGAAADTDFSGPFTLTQNTWYRILLKVENGGGGYGLHLRFANANRTARTGCTFYTTDATAPSAPSSLAAAGVTSGTWQNTVSSPTFTWTSGTDSQGSGQGVSGVRGQKYYFGTSSSGTPGTFQAGTSYAPGAQTDGTYYFKVDTIDYALNESSVQTFIFKYDATPPTTATLGFDTIGTGSIEVTGAGTDALSGVNGSTGYNYSRTGGSDSGGTGTSYTWSGLTPNTEYTGLKVTVRDEAGNTTASSEQSKYTLIQTPAGVSFGTITTTTIDAAPSGTLNNLAAGTSGVRVSNTTAGNDSGWEQDTSGYTSSGLVANTEYTFVARAKNAEGVETGDSISVKAWTLSVPPGAGSVTPDGSSPGVNSTVTWTAAGGFGAGKVQKYKYAWTQNAEHTWTGSETDWSTGTVQTEPTAAGTWYLHVKGYNGANVENGTAYYTVTGAPLSVGGTTSAAP